MPRVSLNQTAFTAGELSPRVLGRTDLDRYALGLKKCRNAHPVTHGGVKRRPGTLYTAAAGSDTANATILVPFVQGRSQAFMLEFGNATVRIFNADGTYTGTALATPYNVAALASLDWAQSEATMYLFSSAAPIQRLQRIGTTWVLSAAPFTTQPFAEAGLQPAASATLSAATVGVGRTLTASGATFLAADVGRAVTYGAGIAVLTAYTSATVVTVEINRAFASTALPAGEWEIDSSPQTACTPSAKDPEGAGITLTLAAAGWRTTDVGSLARINGGLCEITAYTSATVVNATILQVMTATVAAPALSWTLEPQVWTAAYGYPRTGTVYQQRLVVAGSTKYPRTVWGSRAGETLDFELGTNDDDAFSFTIDSDESAAISFLTSSPDLLVLTESGEYSMRGGVEKPITPTNVRVKQEANHGAAQVRPALIGRETVFVQKAGRKLRALSYSYNSDGYAAPDVTALAEHVTKGGIVWLAYQQEPESMLWAVRADGALLSCTIDRDQQPSVIAWAVHSTDGAVECVASLPSDSSEQVWCIVRRTIGGITKRYIERLDDAFEPLHPSVTTDGPVYGCTVDCGLVVDNPAGQTTFTGLAHLERKSVDIVADGSKMPRKTVTGGSITIERASKRTLIGLPFSSEVQLLNPEFSTGTGSAAGKAARTGEVVLRFLDSIGATITDSQGSSQQIPFRRFGTGILDEAPQPFTGSVPVSLLGWSRGEAELSVVQNDPMPMHLLSVTRTHTVNG